MALEGGETLLAHAGPDARRLRCRAGRRRARVPRLPGDGPPGHLGVPGASLPPYRGANDAAAHAPPPPHAAGQVCQGALRKEVDARWPSLPPSVTAVPAATMVPTTTSRRHRRAAAALHRNTAKVAGALSASAAALPASFSGSCHGVFGASRAREDASPSTLAPQAVPGSWDDLMDVDDAAAEKATGLGAAALWGS